MKTISKQDLAAKTSERVQELERELSEQSKSLLDYRKEHGKLEVFFDRVIKAIKPISPAPIIYKPDKSTVRSNCVAVIQLSDWHTGEVQDAQEVEFINGYNPQIQQQRIANMDKVFLRWNETLRGNYVINECRVIVTGDLISGDIHSELSVTNAYPVPVQVCEAARMLALSIATKAQAFNKLTVDFIVPDNHSRLTHKPQSKEGGYNSLNYIVGMMAKQYLDKHSNVEFNIHIEAEKVIEINGMRYLCAHGNALKSWQGVPWYGIERHIGKEAKARQHIMMGDMENIIEIAKRIGFNKFTIGHFHSYINTAFFHCCGSLSGTSAYDHQAGRFDHPCQSAWMVHEKHGELNHMNIRL